MRDFTASLQELERLLRTTAIQALEESVPGSKFRAVDAEPDPVSPLLAPWMALILVNSLPIRVIFTTHFKIRDASLLAADPLGVSAARVSDSDALDFMKEYSNLVGGRLKRALETQSIASGISLPLVMRGFDYLYIKPADERIRFLRQWRLVGPVSMKCAAVIDVLDPAALGQMTITSATTPTGVPDRL